MGDCEPLHDCAHHFGAVVQLVGLKLDMLIDYGFKNGEKSLQLLLRAVFKKIGK
jgi:hypothetical protein